MRSVRIKNSKEKFTIGKIVCVGRPNGKIAPV